MRRTVPLVTRAGIVGAVISALILAAAPAGVLGSGAPLFQPYQAIPVGSWPEAVAIGDVTGDGRNDVVMTTNFNLDPARDFRLWVFAQAPDGTFQTPVSYATAATYATRTGTVAVGDITGDGKADVVVGLLGPGGFQVFPQVANGTLGTPTLYATNNSFKIRLGQLNGDGRLDVAGIGSGTNTVSVFLNDGHGSLLPATSYAAQHAGYDDLEVADVSNDGRDDLVVMSGQGFVPNISVLAQKAGGGFGPAAEYRVDSIWFTSGIGVGDVTGDGRKDVVASYGGNRPTSYIAVFAQNSAGTLDAAVSYPSLDNPGPVEVADLDVDGRADVVTLHNGWYAAGVYRQQGNGALAAEELYTLPYASYEPHGLAVSDINGDWAPDVAIADYNSGLVVLRNTSTPPPPPQLTALTAPKVWVGLKNSDDVGIRLDLRAEVSMGNTLVTSGEATSVAAGSSGFNNAVLDTIPLNAFAPVAVLPGSQLTLRLYVRNACSGSTHSSGVARLWYNDAAANSAFGATIAGTSTTDYLVVGSRLSTSPGTGPQASIDGAAGTMCSAFKPFGTWSLFIP
jgi:hypothetical protein